MNLGYIQERKYTSVTLLYHYAGTTDASSGIYILDDEGDNYIVSIVDIHVADIKDFSVKYTCGELIDESNVRWINVPVSEDKLVVREIMCSDLEDFFDNCKYQDVRKKYVLRIELPQFCTIRNELKEFKIIGSKKRKGGKKSIRIESSPFGLSTVDIFNGYTNYGHVNYESKNYEFVLSDCKFMDNMNGGIVFVDGSYDSIGLIWGNIKWKGHGELMIILNWDVILDAMGIPRKELDDEVDAEEESGSWVESYKKVVGLKVLDTYGIVSWGSGIIIDRGVIATNKHVVTGNIVNNETPKCIEIKYNDGDDVMNTICIEEPQLGKEIFMPIDGRQDHDVCFLKVGEEALDISGIRVVGGGLLKEYEGKKGIQTGEYSVSIGYGLFYEHGKLDAGKVIGERPLQSVGTVSKVHGSNSEMIISSSSCWSGCSGGAVVNSRGELLGVMVSNVRHLATGEVLERVNFSIGVPVVSACYRSLVAARQRVCRDTHALPRL